VRAIGFGDEITKKVLTDLVDARFALTTSHQAPTFEASFVASRLGGHIVRQFISNFAFLENVLMDTFITETVVWNELREEISSVYQQRDRVRRMEHRVNAVNLFFDYMLECYSILSDESSKRGLRREWCVNPFAAAQSQLSTNVEAVLASARRPRSSLA
jgi:hypothetical protein